MKPHDFHNLTAEQIAFELERERIALAQKIDGLRDRISTDNLIDDVLGYASAYTRPYANVVDRAVRANPVAAVMVGAGLAWLLLGRPLGARAAATPATRTGTRFEDLSRWEDEGGPTAPLPEADAVWVAEADGLRVRAADILSELEAAARQGLRSAAELAEDRVVVLTDLARSTRAAMVRGLEGLGEEAQSRIVAVREQAYAARIEAVRQGTRLVEERPVLAGAISAAIGAAVAAILPRSRTEDRMSGADRDRLLAEAHDAYLKELARART